MIRICSAEKGKKEPRNSNEEREKPMRKRTGRRKKLPAAIFKGKISKGPGAERSPEDDATAINQKEKIIRGLRRRKGMVFSAQQGGTDSRHRDEKNGGEINSQR